MTIHTLTAFFDERAHADEAVALLGQVGLSDPSVTLSPFDARDEFATFDPLSAGAPKRKGFWGMLEDLFGGSDDHDLYAEGVRRGSTMLTAQVDDEQLDQAVEILDRHGSIDLNEREVSWRNDGWLGGSVGMPFGASVVPPASDLDRMRVTSTMAPVEPAPVITPADFAVSSPIEAPVAVMARSTMEPERIPATSSDLMALNTERRDTDVLQVVEERLVVAKRSVSRGKVRVHSYTVETPVTAEIRLRDETVRIDRQTTDRTVSAEDLKVEGFQDRTIEMEEVDEEPVISKTARVVEEIGLRKDVSNHNETIHETVRSTKVDIDDGRDTVAESKPKTATQSYGSADNLPIEPL